MITKIQNWLNEHNIKNLEKKDSLTDQEYAMLENMREYRKVLNGE